MTVTSPNIDVTFKQLASTAVSRSQNGYAILIVKDDTTTSTTATTENITLGDAVVGSAIVGVSTVIGNETITYFEYSELTEVNSADYTAANYQYIEDIFVSSPYMVCVVKISSTGLIDDALTIVKENVATGWITIADGSAQDFTTLQSWIATQDGTNKQTYKAVVFQATTLPDNMHIVNFVNDYVTFSDTSRGKVSGLEYCPSLIGILAKCNITEGCNYFICSNLSKVTEVADNNVALGAGEFVLINDGSYVRILRGINTMTTTNGSTKTEDMKEIEVIEAMDLMQNDISTTFKNDYLGKYKNKYDNQVLFLSAVNSYFKGLEGEDVLDDEYDNVASINIEAQRQALISAGKTDASNWTDAQIKQETYKRSLFLTSNVKILQSFVDLDFVINLD